MFIVHIHISEQLLDFLHPSFLKLCFDTVNSEIFARVYFSETLHLRSFMKNKNLAKNGEITAVY